ncbi:hypothetical protein N7462_000113 [Penicillium macrosclerotiorum]|uniref:uncharacterized protein n=1 Tax=Penicillium macrosclerotiorum TaxID=303699 RepID=UPI0025491328|nr:uncharacterized protein N7462_000113 [Penicillium macrosclerotiorum]KAJ5698108.1 hypothetical protein N7462_000113 [Penicillium macrosclerotiorum]
MRSSSKAKTDVVIKRQKKKSIACRRCHTHKIKCSGGQPCTKCRTAGCATECTYVNRDRQIKVHESYIDQLAAENERLREQISHSPVSVTPSDTINVQGQTHTAHLPDATTQVQNPMLGERAWFQPYDPSAPPIYVAEAACTAFATRLRQVLTKDKTTSHMARTQYTSEATLMKIRNPAIEWPTHAQARLLTQIVFNQVSRVYHLVLRKSTLEELDEAYRTEGFDDPVMTCKFFSLFALGEVYSARSNSTLDCGVPGAAYYVNAMTLIPILPERPSLTHIESILLLSLYSYFLNRRHSAFLLVGSAMRLGLTLGLNYDIPECQCPNPVDRQHRIRLWWAIYVFDRMYGSKAGWPIQIADDDINVEMPSDVPGDIHDEQFSDTKFLTASIQLAQITGQVIEKVYSRKKQPDSFLQREQKLLMSLKQWAQALPLHLRLNRDGPIPKNVISLHLQFNQCIILATRPILLYSLIQSRDSSAAGEDHTSQSHAQTLKTLSDACIHAARHNHSLTVDEWINGSLPIFGYFYAHYLFSTALVMVISSQIHPDNYSDYELFETSLEILHAMSDHGNLAAAEFYDNLECVRQCIHQKQGLATHQSLPAVPSRTSEQPHPTPNLGLLPDQPERGLSDLGLPTGTGLPETSLPSNINNEMIFLDESMEEFLAQPDLDFGPLDPSGIPINVADAVYSWPSFSLWTA